MTNHRGEKLTLNHLAMEDFIEDLRLNPLLCGKYGQPFVPEDSLSRFPFFQCPDYFVVGYGMDFAELYRNLPYIAVLKKEKYQCT